MFVHAESETRSFRPVWAMHLSAPTWSWRHHNGNTQTHTQTQGAGGGVLLPPGTLAMHTQQMAGIAPPKEDTAEEFWRRSIRGCVCGQRVRVCECVRVQAEKRRLQ